MIDILEWLTVSIIFGMVVVCLTDLIEIWFRGFCNKICNLFENCKNGTKHFWMNKDEK